MAAYDFTAPPDYGIQTIVLERESDYRAALTLDLGEEPVTASTLQFVNRVWDDGWVTWTTDNAPDPTGAQYPDDLVYPGSTTHAVEAIFGRT